MVVAQERKPFAPFRLSSEIFVVNGHGELLLQNHHYPYMHVTLVIMDWNSYEQKPKSWWECSSSLYESKWYSLKHLQFADYIRQGFCVEYMSQLTNEEWWQRGLFPFLDIRGIFQHFTFQGQCAAPSTHCSSFEGHWYYLRKNENKRDGNNANTSRRKWKIGYHGTSFYGLRSITVHDLMPGWNHHDEDGPTAIYIYIYARRTVC